MSSPNPNPRSIRVQSLVENGVTWTGISGHLDQHIRLLGPAYPVTWTWAQHVASRNVKVLELYIEVEEDVDDPMEFPGCVFTCRTLEELKPAVPYIGASLSPLPSVRLGWLKKLHLHRFYADRGTLKKLIAGCPCSSS